MLKHCAQRILRQQRHVLATKHMLSRSTIVGYEKSFYLTTPSPLVWTSQPRFFATTPVVEEESEETTKKPRRSRSKSTETKKQQQPKRRKRKSKQVLQEELETALAKGGDPVLRVDHHQIPKYSERVVGFVKRVPELTIRGTSALVRAVYILLTDPSAAMEWTKSMKVKVQAEIKHYWLGSKLLYADVSTSTRILRRVLAGNPLSRREKKQLQRTVSDLIRLVPFSFFIIIPFMEFLLPVALKLFPNMLPSTFQDSYEREEKMKKELKLRLSLAEFLQNAVKDVMKGARDAENVTEETRATAQEVLQFIEQAQSGESLSSEEILKFATLFNDELMLDNISRPQLVGMCRFMGLQPYGNDNFLRFQLRNKIRQLKKDDQEIIWEGLDSLTKEELQSACADRGMRSTGLTKAGYYRQLKQWLDLSISKNVPASLLIMSRALNITAAERPEIALVTSMSSMDEEVVTEVALEAAVNAEAQDIRELRLESIRYQNELIADEEKDRVEAALKKDEEVEMEPAMVDIAQPIDEMFGKPARELTLDQVSSLETLVFSSSVEKERQALLNLKELKQEMDVSKLLASGRIGSKVMENKSTDRMMDKLDSMISNLEDELTKVDETIGDRLNFLDKDKDGVLSKEELKAAIKNILKQHNTEEEAEWAVSQIDENKDGKVTVAELVQWIEKRTNLMELTGAKKD